MFAPGLQAVLLGLCLILGVMAQGGKEGLRIRPRLPKLCKEAPNTSDCGGEVQFKWYYDMFSDSCKVFPHRGCDTSNIFTNRVECVQVCIKTLETQPKPWEDTTSVDQLDEIYGRPVMKPQSESETGRMQFTAAEPNQVGLRSAIEGRSLPGSRHSPNFSPRHTPLIRAALGNFNGDRKPYDPSVGFPPRGFPRMPHDIQHPIESPGRFGEEQTYNDKQDHRMAPGFHSRNAEEKSPIDLMTDEDILDKIGLSERKPANAPPMKRKAATDSDFMSDSDIFESLPEKKPYEEKPRPDENDADFSNAQRTPQCMQFPETGPCRAYIRRWYFDPRKHDCFTFIYGGCDGNKNSFETKYDCMKMCATTSREEMEQASAESMRPPPSINPQFGLRKQRNPPPVVLTSPATNHTPPVTSAPEEPEAKNAKLEEQESEQSGDDSSDEVSDMGSESDSQEVSASEIEGRKADIGPHVTNHYYTYHNYGPRHSNYGAFNPSSKSPGDDPSSLSLKEGKELKKDVQKKFRKQKKKKNGSSKALPFNMFFKFLKRLRPRKPMMMMRKEEQPEGRRTKQGGVKLVTLLFTKRGRQQDNVFNPFSPLTSLSSPRQPGPFSIFFSRPESQPVSVFRSHPPHYNNGPPYYNEGPHFENGPQYNSRPDYDNGPRNHYDNRPHYNNGPHYSSPPFMNGPSSYHVPEPMSNPIRSLLFPSMDRLFPPMSSIFNQFQGPSLSTSLMAPQGEKNVACGKPVSVGSCPDSPLISQWYYDAERGVCDVFFYTGCGGNENRFGSLKQCHDVCVVLTPAPPIAKSRPTEKENAIPPVKMEIDPVSPQPVEAQQRQPEETEPKELEQLLAEQQQQPEPVEMEAEVPAEEASQFETSKEEQYEVEQEQQQEQEKEKETEEKAKENETDEQKKVDKLKEEQLEEGKVAIPHQPVHGTPVVHTFEFATMHLDTRMEYVLVVIIMVLGGAALIVLVAITAYFMYKKHKLAVRNHKEAAAQKLFHAHAYPEVQKISVIELLRQVQPPGSKDIVLKNANPQMS